MHLVMYNIKQAAQITHVTDQNRFNLMYNAVHMLTQIVSNSVIITHDINAMSDRLATLMQNC